MIPPIHPAALNELVEAASYYDARKPGLGREFDEAVHAALLEIADHPTRWPRLLENVRRYRLKRFPYGIVYRVRADAIDVVAVMHLHRRTGYWMDRL